MTTGTLKVMPEGPNSVTRPTARVRAPRAGGLVTGPIMMVLYGLYRDGSGQVSFAGTWTTDQNHVLSIVQELAAVQ